MLELSPELSLDLERLVGRPDEQERTEWTKTNEGDNKGKERKMERFAFSTILSPPIP